MTHPEWIKILVISFFVVSIINGLICSFSSSYYKKTPLAKLTHSQLRIKQGNASIEQRFNVFVLSLLFSVTSLRIITITLFVAVSMNFTLGAL